MNVKKLPKQSNPVYKETTKRDYSHVISHGHVASKHIMDLDKDTK